MRRSCSLASLGAKCRAKDEVALAINLKIPVFDPGVSWKDFEAWVKQ